MHFLERIEATKIDASALPPASATAPAGDVVPSAVQAPSAQEMIRVRKFYAVVFSKSVALQGAIASRITSEAKSSGEKWAKLALHWLHQQQEHRSKRAQLGSDAPSGAAASAPEPQLSVLESFAQSKKELEIEEKAQRTWLSVLTRPTTLAGVAVVAFLVYFLRSGHRELDS